jgi:PadR family transcriptional regulator PadR
MELLTKLEELVLIAVLKVKDNAYGISIYNFIVDITGKDVTVSSVYFPLERLVRKGYLRSQKGESTPKRGGMSKKYYYITKSGIKVLEENRLLSQSAWQGVAEILKSAWSI